MSRYFLEVAYKGERFAGFQIQDNAPTIQGEINRSLETLLRHPVTTFGSSRTDSGVHALQNFLHIDLAEPVPSERIYNLNAILSPDITLKKIHAVRQEAHARFSATARSYKYVIYRTKDPFLKDFGYFFPYPVDLGKMQAAADLLPDHQDFSSFSKRNTQVKTFDCAIQKVSWNRLDGQLQFHITANRFLRGMVRGLVATMLKVGRAQLSLEEFEQLLRKKQCSAADFSAPPQGLFLEKVHYPSDIFLP